MNFYSSISENYDYIFPYNKKHKDYIEKSVNTNSKKSKILDIGCGTCNLAIELAKDFGEVTAIDLDIKMIEKGKIKKGNKYPNLNIKVMDMTKIDEHFQDEYFDVISCFGNTLVHLENIDAISDFFRKTFACLKLGGVFLLQVINYDRIIQNNVTGLKTIENNKIKFVRNYYKNDNEKLDFETILTVKESGEEIENTIELYPIVKSEIERAIGSGGFSKIEYFGSFDMDELTNDSIPLVIRAEK